MKPVTTSFKKRALLTLIEALLILGCFLSCSRQQQIQESNTVDLCCKVMSKFEHPDVKMEHHIYHMTLETMDKQYFDEKVSLATFTKYNEGDTMVVCQVNKEAAKIKPYESSYNWWLAQVVFIALAILLPGICFLFSKEFGL